MLKKFNLGVAAGILISLGGAAYLACDNKYIGALLFSVALLSICHFGYSLYTGKICYMVEKHDKDAFETLLLCILGNLVGTTFCGYALKFAVSSLSEKAYEICTAKLEQAPAETLFRGLFCGLCIFVAVEVYRKKNSTLGIFVAIPVFILSGFEHSIADMFYFAISGIVSFKAFLFIMIVVVGNSIGGMLLLDLTKERGKKKND